MAGFDGSIRINTQLNTREFERGSRGLISGMERLGRSLNGIISSLGFGLGIAGLVALGKQAIDIASDIQEVQNVVDTAFGSMAYKMEEFAKTSVRQFGISQLSAKQMGSTFMAMGASMLDNMEKASDMAINLTARAADMSSFYNKSIEETSYALKSIYTGETESLKEYGVVMTQVNMEEFARQQGINKSIQAMTQAEKVELQYAYVMQQTALAAGDFARTSDSWANQTRILSEQFKELLSVLGSGLITVLTPVVKFLNTVLSTLIAIAKQIGAILSKLFGISIPVADSGQFASDLSAAAGGADELASGMDAAGKSAEKAGKAASKALAPFDKLNVLGKESGSGGGSGSGSGGGGGAGGGFEMPELSFKEDAEGADSLGGALDGILDRLKQLKDLFAKGFFEGLGDYKPILAELKKDIISIGQTLKEIFTDPEVIAAANRLADQLAYSLGQVVGSAARIGLTIAQNLVGGIEKFLTQNKERIKQYIVSMLDIGTEIAAITGNFSVALADIFSVFGGDTAQQITANLIGIFAEVGMMISENAAKLGRDILNMITKPIIDNKDKIKDAIEGTLETIEPFTSGLLKAIQKIRDAVTKVYDEHLKPLFDSIADGLSKIIRKLLDGYNQYIVPVFQGLGERFKEIMEGPFGETVDKVAAFIGKLIDAVKLLWESVLVPFFAWAAENIMPVLAPIVDFVGKTLLSVLETIIKVIGDIADVLSGIIDFVVGVFTGNWEKAWNGIKGIFGGIWNLIKDILSGVWDRIKINIRTSIDFVKKIISAAWNGIKKLTSEIWNGIKEFISGSWKKIQDALKKIPDWFKEKFDKAKENIHRAFEGIGGWFSARYADITNAFSNISAWFKEKFTKAKENVHEAFRAIGSWFGSRYSDIQNAFKNVASWFDKKFKKAYSNATNAFSEARNAFSAIWGNITGAFGDIAGWFREKFSAAWQAVTGVFSNVKEFMVNVGKNIVNGIIEGIMSIWSTLIDMANKIKDLFNIKVNVSGASAGGGAFGGIVGGMGKAVPYSSQAAAYSPSMASASGMDIPQLASGAVIRGGNPFLAVLGEQRFGQTNIEAPLSTIEKAVSNVVKKNGGAGGDINVRVFLGEKDITKAVKVEADTYFKKTGKDLFMH